MTIKEALSGKIEELNIARSHLIEISLFLNPDNNMFVYHSLSLEKISGTTGSTPYNLSEILGVVTKEINDYVEYISQIPNKESSVIRRERGVNKYAILSTRGLIPAKVTWDELSENSSFMSVQQFLPMSKYKGFVRTITVHSAPSFRKGGENNPEIDFDVVFLRINVRKNICEEYYASSGYLNITLDNDHLFGDDIFIIGFRPRQKILKTSVYYSRLEYSIKIEGEDDSIEENVYTIGGTRVGNIIPDIDDSLDNGILYWSMFTLNEFTVECARTEGSNVVLIPKNYTGVLGSTYNGIIIEELMVDGISMDISRYNVSYRSGIEERSILVDDTYRLYDISDNGVNKIIFKNVRPIDIVLEEAIHAL